MPDAGQSLHFEILEHTADIGVRSEGSTLEEAFENAARGALEIMGARARPGARSGGQAHHEEARVEASDREALLVALMDELIYLVETGEDGVEDVRVRFEGPASLEATIWWGPRQDPEEGIELKAATYHRVSVRERADGRWEAMVYFDV